MSDTVAAEITAMILESETDPKVKEGMERIIDVYENAGYLPSLTDWEQMNDEEKAEMVSIYDREPDEIPKFSDEPIRKIKDFKRLQKGYLAECKHHDIDSYIKEVEIIKVGRKYVEIKDIISPKWEEPKNKESYLSKGLVPVNNCGDKTHLFTCKEDAKEYLERCSIAQAIRDNSYLNRLSMLSTEDLRKIERILFSVKRPYDF